MLKGLILMGFIKVMMAIWLSKGSLRLLSVSRSKRNVEGKVIVVIVSKKVMGSKRSIKKK